MILVHEWVSNLVGGKEEEGQLTINLQVNGMD